MATVSAFPTPSNGGVEYLRLTDLPIEHLQNVTKYVMEDGSCEVNVQPCAVQKWQLDYDGLDETQAQTLIAHRDLAKGRVNDFSFFHARDGVNYSGAKYFEFERIKHQKWWSQPIRIVLIKLL